MVGQVRDRVGAVGGTEWFNPETNTWQLAVYHDEIRDVLIAQQAALGAYRFPRRRGTWPNDITAYKAEHRDWGEDRANWPPILFQYERTPADRQSLKSGIWIHQGAVVLDVVNDPVLAYPELPLTITSEESGTFMEAYFRLNHHITYKDVRARMRRNPKGDWTVGGADTIRAGSLGMRMTRFRERAGLLSWSGKKGSKEIKRFLDGLIPQHLRDANTVRGFRNLRPHEIAFMHLDNIGNFPERARGEQKDFSDEKKKSTHDAAKKRAEDLKKAYEETGHETSPDDGAGSATGRSSIDEDEMMEDVDENDEHDGAGSDVEMVEAPASSTGETVDFLLEAAVTADHQQLLQNLLMATRQSYLLQTGQNPPDTSQGAPYSQQWFELQTAFQAYWVVTGAGGEVPILTGITRLDPANEEVEWNVAGPELSPLAWRMIRIVFHDLY